MSKIKVGDKILVHGQYKAVVRAIGNYVEIEFMDDIANAPYSRGGGIYYPFPLKLESWCELEESIMDRLYKRMIEIYNE